jgi:hypothetical protein
LEEFQRRCLSHFITIDRSLFEIEEIGKYFGRVLKFYSLGESREFFCNLEMVERKNDIAQIVKDDFNRRMVHFSPLPRTLSSRRLCCNRAEGQATSFGSFRIAGF